MARSNSCYVTRTNETEKSVLTIRNCVANVSDQYSSFATARHLCVIRHTWVNPTMRNKFDRRTTHSHWTSMWDKIAFSCRPSHRHRLTLRLFVNWRIAALLHYSPKRLFRDRHNAFLQTPATMNKVKRKTNKYKYISVIWLYRMWIKLTSGAAYGGEPHQVANNSSGLKKFENPKSAILIFLFESNSKFSACKWNKKITK